MNEIWESETQSEVNQTTNRIATQVFLEMTDVVLMTENTIVKYLSNVIKSRWSTVDIERNLCPKSIATQI